MLRWWLWPGILSTSFDWCTNYTRLCPMWIWLCLPHLKIWLLLQCTPHGAAFEESSDISIGIQCSCLDVDNSIMSHSLLIYLYWLPVDSKWSFIILKALIAKVAEGQISFAWIYPPVKKKKKAGYLGGVNNAHVTQSLAQHVAQKWCHNQM